MPPWPLRSTRSSVEVRRRATQLRVNPRRSLLLGAHALGSNVTNGRGDKSLSHRLVVTSAGRRRGATFHWTNPSLYTLRSVHQKMKLSGVGWGASAPDRQDEVNARKEGKPKNAQNEIPAIKALVRQTAPVALFFFIADRACCCNKCYNTLLSRNYVKNPIEPGHCWQNTLGSQLKCWLTLRLLKCPPSAWTYRRVMSNIQSSGVYKVFIQTPIFISK